MQLDSWTRSKYIAGRVMPVEARAKLRVTAEPIQKREVNGEERKKIPSNTGEKPHIMMHISPL